MDAMERVFSSRLFIFNYIGRGPALMIHDLMCPLLKAFSIIALSSGNSGDEYQKWLWEIFWDQNAENGERNGKYLDFIKL